GHTAGRAAARVRALLPGHRTGWRRRARPRDRGVAGTGDGRARQRGVDGRRGQQVHRDTATRLTPLRPPTLPSPIPSPTVNALVGGDVRRWVVRWSRYGSRVEAAGVLAVAGRRALGHGRGEA